ncbi:colanic acid biosynthesis glycosyltransferase WcaI [Thioclava sp. BHET1]|nr:colanic acid biosynthesis glycosyltransferase WcaI [Thioclava sp. BHET1]
MKFLILGINYAPEMIGIAVYTSQLAEGLAARGHDVEVVTAQPYYPAWQVMEGWPRFGYRAERPMKNLRVTHCPLYVPATPTGAKRLLHYASFTLSAAPKLLARAVRQRPDHVLVVAPSLVSAPLGRLAARLSGAQSWLHIQDFEVEAAFATGFLTRGTRFGRLAEWFEHRVLSGFDRISTISRPMLAKLEEKGIARDSIFELRNWADLSRVTPMTEPSPLKVELGITTPHVALYSGNVARKQGIEIIPEAARRLRHRSDLTFVICGNGPYVAELKAQTADLPHVRYFPLQPIERLSQLLGMADLHLLPQIADAADLVLPSKLTNMLASGRPVIATAAEGTALAEEIAGCGARVVPGDSVGFAAAIEDLLRDPARLAAIGVAARARAEERWDRERIIDQCIATLSAAPHLRSLALSEAEG